MVAMVTMRAEGHLSRLSMHKTGPLRSHSAFKMTVRMRCLWRQTTKGLEPKHSVDSGKRGNPVAFQVKDLLINQVQTHLPFIYSAILLCCLNCTTVEHCHRNDMTTQRKLMISSPDVVFCLTGRKRKANILIVLSFKIKCKCTYQGNCRAPYFPLIHKKRETACNQILFWGLMDSFYLDLKCGSQNVLNFFVFEN